MNNILCLLGKNKKELKKFIINNKIDCYKKTKKSYCFDIIFLHTKHTCEIHIFKNTINSIHLFVADERKINSISFNDSINKYKGYFNLEYGNPISDNTNHPTNNVAISYKNENCVVYIFGQSDINQIKIIISTIGKDIDYKMYSLNSIIKYLLYLGGGLLWGLLMFLTMSYKEYSWTNFGIYMIGGLLWALLFGIIFELVINLTPKQSKIKMKQINKIEENENKFNYEISSCGQVYFLKKLKSKSYTAKMYLSDNIFKILFYKKGKLHKIEENIDVLSKNLGFGHLTFKIEDERISFNLCNRDEFNNIKEYIDEKLGYHSSKFVEIYSLVKNVVIEYNPYSLYNANNKKVFDYEIDIISRRIFEKENMSLDELKEVTLIAFDYDSSTQVYKELPTLLYNEVYKYEVIYVNKTY